MDLTPRHEIEETEDVRQLIHRRRRWAILAISVLLIAALAFVTAQGLRNATLFFRNVDEAIDQRANLGTSRFRIQGRVIPSSVQGEAGVTTFQIVHECAVAAVRHTGDPPELFESPWIPVVLEGRWVEGESKSVAGADSHYFRSDRMLVKHTNEYASANEGRVSEKPPAGFLDDCSFEVPVDSS